MNQIATIAGEFIVSLAQICSDRQMTPTVQFKQARDTFLECVIPLIVIAVQVNTNGHNRKLHDVAQKCINLSQLTLLSRFFQQALHKDELLGIKQSLQYAVGKFQVCSNHHRTQV